MRSEDARSWMNLLLNLGASPNRVLINLDAHPDRTLGARSLECTIVAQQKAAQVFRSRPSVFKGQNAESGSEWETYEDVMGTRWALPDITYTTRIAWHWGEQDVICEHHAGPAPGATWVSIPAAQVVFVGDAVLPNQPPFLTNAEIPAWIETLDVLLKEYRNSRIVSGRGGVVSYDDVRLQRQHLKNIFKSLERLGKQNANPEDVEKLIPGLLADLKFAEGLKEQYIQRYRHGLCQYFTRHYRPAEFSSE
ncbi:MAG: hypothetical protein JW726_06940 [Anaerolineales bacterium]|nr:hypothetical protein [Anaerolineales bacterium]